MTNNNNNNNSKPIKKNIYQKLTPVPPTKINYLKPTHIKISNDQVLFTCSSNHHKNIK